MKKMKKSGWIAAVLVAVALLTTVALVIGCRPPVGNWDEQAGNIRMNFGYQSVNGRTALPIDATLEDDFSLIELVFTPPSGPALNPIYVNVSELNASSVSERSFNMNPGNYNVVATGYIPPNEATYINPVASHDPDNFGSAAPATTDIAGWWAGPVTVSGTSGQVIEGIILRGDSRAGEGFFFYDIIDATTGVISKAEMKITPIAPTTGSALTIPLIEDTDPPNEDWEWVNETGTRTLDTGFYYLDFEFTRDGSPSIFFRHVLQVYQNLISKFEYTLTDDYFYITSVEILVEILFEKPDDDNLAPKISSATPAMLPATDTTYNVAYPVVEMTKAGDSTVDITITVPVTGTTLSWVCLAAGGPYTGTITAGTAFTLGDDAPFTTPGKYLVTVEGKIPTPAAGNNAYSGPFSTSFMVMVDE